MRIMMMHKSDADTEAGKLPSPQLIAGMGKLMEEVGRSGMLLGGEGLLASSKGVRLNFKGGKRTITKGPFVGNNELPAGFAIVKVESLDVAIEWATRFAEVVGDVEIDVRPVTEYWDLGVMPKPPGLTTTRYMMMHKANAASEAGVPPTPELMEKMGKLMEEMHQAGIFVAGEGLHRSATATRLQFKGGKCTVTDGPFAESKELIAGYVILNVPSKAEAIAFAPRFAAIVGDVEIDVRQVAEESDFAPQQ